MLLQYLVVTATLSITLLVVTVWHLEGHIKSSRKNNQLTSIEIKDSLKILVWTTGETRVKDFYLLEMATCKAKCSFTDDKTLIHEADAVVSHIRDFARPMPKPVKQNQLRVLLSREPPISKPKSSPNIYNWTFTFRLDSDVPIKWGRYERMPNFSLTTSDVNFTNTSHLNKQLSLHLPPRRNKLVAWIVSNCKTQSQREKYVSELRKYVPVDVYGRCGALKCKHSRQDRCKNDVCESCYLELAKNYKFILAFENSLCLDYVTEKLFDTLVFTDLVPVVYGAVNYTKFAPPMSFIDVSKFSSAKDLADYLLFLNKNPEQYLMYLLWKERYRVVASCNRWCDLCKKMSEVSILDEFGNRIIDPGYSKYYENITKWWWFQPSSKELVNESDIPACSAPKVF